MTSTTTGTRRWKQANDLAAAQFRVQQGMVPTSDVPSVELAYVSVFPPEGVPLRGVVLFLHGYGEHSGRFFELFETLSHVGFGVVAYDLRSHGRSHKDVPDLKAHVDNFQEFILDTNDVLAFAKKSILPQMGAASNTPWIIMGFSLGSLVGLHTVLTQKHEFKGIVLLGPAIAAEMTFVLRIVTWVAGLLSVLTPTSRVVPGVNQDFICHDNEYLEDFEKDPLCTRELMTARIGAELLGGIEALNSDTRVEKPDSFFCQIPLLMVMGSMDKVTSLPLAQVFYDRIATQDKYFEVVDGAFHAILEEPNRAEILRTISDWLQARFPALQAATQ